MTLLHAAQLKVILDTDTVTPDDGDLKSYLIGLLGLPDFLLLLQRRRTACSRTQA